MELKLKNPYCGCDPTKGCSNCTFMELKLLIQPLIMRPFTMF